MAAPNSESAAFRVHTRAGRSPAVTYWQGEKSTLAPHFGSSVGISISLAQSRARIPVGIGAAEVSDSDHDEIAQLCRSARHHGGGCPAGICPNRVFRSPPRLRIRDLMALCQRRLRFSPTLMPLRSRKLRQPAREAASTHQALRQESGARRNRPICRHVRYSGTAPGRRYARGSRGGCA
jgi:hypothetical protein